MTDPLRRYRRLSPAQEAELVSLWEGGGFTAEDLAHRFGLSRRGIQAALVRLGAVKARAADQAIIAAASHALAVLPPVPTDPADRVRDARESAYNDATRLQRLAMVAAEQAVQELGGVASIRVLARVADIVTKARVTAWAALGLDGRMPVTEGDLPELPIRELTQAEIAEILDQQAREDLALGLEPARQDEVSGADFEPEIEVEVEIEGERPSGHDPLEWGGGNDA